MIWPLGPKFLKKFRWFFGRNDGTNKTFWNQLTFRKHWKSYVNFQLCENIRLILALMKISTILLRYPTFEGGFFKVVMGKTNKYYSRVLVPCRGWVIIIWTGLNIKIGIAQKVYELWNCSFAKMIVPSGENFGKSTVS